jgi:hypothetical protein
MQPPIEISNKQEQWSIVDLHYTKEHHIFANTKVVRK